MEDFWSFLKFWTWNKKEELKEQSFTIDQVEELLEEVKKFNAGVIDQYLDRHVDRVFKE